jgi:antitoxin component YwqK of YwqJK toxin-antitoxin module
MFRSIILTLFVVFASCYTYSQVDTLNQVDAEGKKTGWWITYLNANLQVLKDSSGATHCMYNYYVTNNYTYRFGEGYGSKKTPIQFPENDTLKLGDYTLLDGKYITKHKNGNVRSAISASNGILIDFKMYYPNGQLKLEIIYSTECGAPIKHCLKEYKKDGSLKYKGSTWVPNQTE